MIMRLIHDASAILILEASFEIIRVIGSRIPWDQKVEVIVPLAYR